MKYAVNILGRGVVKTGDEAELCYPINFPIREFIQSSGSTKKK
jgi:hypothetical protein